MKEALLIFLAALFIFILVKLILSKKRKARDPVPHYVCDICGELDCICHRVEDNPNK
jgi:hypothetical protein